MGFWQAPPYSDSFTVFYKKSGALFGTEITIAAQSALGPELSIRSPVEGEAQYFEYEIRKLKPSTQYVVKVRQCAQGLQQDRPMRALAESPRRIGP